MTTPSEFRDVLVRDLGGPRTLCVAMQNPSKAEADDPTANDPTILRLIGFTGRLGFGRLVVVNSYLYRATDPKDLYRWLFGMPYWTRDEHRARALAVAIEQAKASEMFIAAWGNGHPEDKWPMKFRAGLIAADIKIHVFGLNKNGTPVHPLSRGKMRIPDDAAPVLWAEAA